VGKKALADAVKRLKLNSEEDLMVAIGTAKLDDRQVMEALVPGSTANLPNPEDWPRQQRAIAVRGLTPGMAFKLADCCHPVPGTASSACAGRARAWKSTRSTAKSWPMAWTPTGSTCRGTSAPMARWAASGPSSITGLARWRNGRHLCQEPCQRGQPEMTQRENPFHTYLVDLEVRDLAHLTRIISALRASDGGPGRPHLAPFLRV
jgi:GTP pyrophosphokinase